MTSSLSLKELNIQIQDTLKNQWRMPIWVRAEISELHEHNAGHCYLELIEKDQHTDQIVARCKATIWASRYAMIKPFFLNYTGMTLQRDMKILMLVTVEFHELYGLSLSVKDIDPTFTIGELAMKRAQIITRLKEEGISEMNKELHFPMLPQRIAVISSDSAAGYGDFCNQLLHNSANYCFYIKLFKASMQGNQTESSIIAALDHIYQYADLFDCVVIIRGGGATAELAAFDNYLLAAHIAQFPLPIITGIGHLRDQSICDLVAHQNVKTPTAAAELLLSYTMASERNLLDLAQSIINNTKQKLDNQKQILKTITLRLPNQINTHLTLKWKNLDYNIARLKQASERTLNNKKQHLALLERDLIHNDPKRLLERGFTLTTCQGKIITSAHQLTKGDMITTHFADGKATATITQLKKNSSF